MNQGYPARHYDFPVKRFVQVLDLTDDPELIEKYKYCHSEQGFWTEIAQQQREVGILDMEIYIHGTRLVMIVEAREDFDWDDAMARLAQMPLQQEWEAFVAKYQGCDPNAKSDEKWQMCERMFRHYDLKD